MNPTILGAAAVMFAAAAVPATGQKNHYVNYWIGRASSASWTTWSDLAKNTDIIGIRERCISGVPYAQIRNNAGDDDTIRFDVTVDAPIETPTTPRRHLTLKPGAVGEAFPVEGHQCALGGNPYHVFFFAIRSGP